MTTKATISVALPHRYGAVAILNDLNTWYTWRQAQERHPATEATRTRFQGMALEAVRLHVESWFPVWSRYDPWVVAITRPARFFPAGMGVEMDDTNDAAERQWSAGIGRLTETPWPLKELLMGGQVDACYDMAYTIEAL